jgi:hypothetical protein
MSESTTSSAHSDKRSDSIRPDPVRSDAVRPDLVLPDLVVIDEPERMNLLGLMLGAILGRSLARRWPTNATGGPGARPRLPACGDVVLCAGRMEVTLHFAPDAVTIRRGAVAKPRARIRGELVALVAAGLRQVGASLWALLRGHLRPWGNPVALWHLFRLLRM